MKILIFSTAYLPFLGGAELAVKEITDRLPDMEFDLITAKLKRGLQDFEKMGNINIYRIGSGSKFLDKPLLPNLGFLKAINLHKEKKYDLVYGVMASQGSAAAYLFKFLYPKVPFLLTLQEGDLGRNSPFDRFWQNRIIKKANAITVISNYLRDFAERLNKKAPVYVIPNGVNLQKFKIKSEKLKINEQKVIITVSRLVKKNGVDILIDAFQILNTKYKMQNAKIIIIGAGAEYKNLKFKIENLKLGDKVSLLGMISHDELPEYLAGADIFVRPSRSEGLGSAFLEAMAVGVPIIGTAAGGITDFLKNGQTGLVCKIENPEDLAEKIKILLENENLRLKLAENGRKLVEEKYNWDKIAGQMKEIYEKTIHSHPGL